MFKAFAVKVFAFLWLLIAPTLEKLAQGLWDEIWEQIIAAVVTAENKWAEAGRGEAKKADVIKVVMEFIESKKKLGLFDGWIVRLFVSKAVDAIVAQINETAGKDWGKKVAEYERQLAEWLPVID
jgi:hypothetical protein